MVPCPLGPSGSGNETTYRIDLELLTDFTIVQILEDFLLRGEFGLPL